MQLADFARLPPDSDLLELKQIMQSLPRARIPACPRLPFTTSMPEATTSSASTAAPPFPISRLAASPSLTPSKWKNRDASSATVDPAILPYLDSVPIRLLPLLPTSPVEPDSAPLPAPIPKDSQSKSATAGPALPGLQSTAPLIPPLTLQSPNGSSPISLASPASISPVQSSTPTRRKPKFSFVPLLPLAEEKKAHEEPAIPLLVHSAPPAKHFNMTFLPLLPPEDAAPSTPTNASPPYVGRALPTDEDTPQKEGPSLEDEARMRREPLDFEDAEASYFPAALSRHRRSPTSTPSLSSASDTDTESDAPSVNSPDPSSPVDDYDALTHYFAAHPPFVGHNDHDHDAAETNGHASHNPYFPAISPIATRPIPHADPALNNTPLLAAPVTRSQPAAVVAAVKKMKLEALPSPALVPPSPFSLYEAGAEAEDTDTEGEDEGEGGAAAVVRVSAVDGSGKSLPVALPLYVSSLPSSVSTSTSASSAASEDGDADTEKEEVDVARLRFLEPSPAPSYVSDTPELTIEAMRDAYDTLAARRIDREAGTSAGELLGPSLSRA